jgi:hypothetical protein
LDTLGFCFWLAFAKRESAKEPLILVLDDVFTSVDAQHSQLLCDLICAERGSFAKIIITSHQRRWRDTFTNSFGPGKYVEVIDLKPWSLQQGISHGPGQTPAQELRDALAQPSLDRQAIASRSGVILEATLDRLTLLFACHLPRSTRPAYELKILIDGTVSLFKELRARRPRLDSDGIPVMPIEYMTESGKAMHDEIRQIYVVRNLVGAHYNIEGSEVLDSEVRRIGEVTLELIAFLECHTCGQIPSKTDGGQLVCSCPSNTATSLFKSQAKGVA